MAKKGLGKGLDGLFAEAVSDNEEKGVIEVRISEVEPNKNQPRKSFDKEKLETLANSIKEHGVIQPLIVTAENGGYTIVAGERRWRAARLAGLSVIPVIVKEYSPQTVTEVALIENLQREDLNPIEEANGYKDLCENYGLTQEQVSKKIGKSRSAIANSMRLLLLEADIQSKLISGEITEGHARAVLSLPPGELRDFLVRRIIDDGLNVREAEKIAKQLQKPSVSKKEEITKTELIEVKRIEDKLSSGLGTKVRIVHGKKKGKIEIEYYGNKDLDRILKIIKM